MSVLSDEHKHGAVGLQRLCAGATVRWLVFLFAVIVLPLAVSYGDRKVTLTVTNGTDLFLNVLVNSDSYLYIQPGGSCRHIVENGLGEGVETFYITAFYSPAQGQTGTFSTTREVQLSYPYSGDVIVCSDNNDDETLEAELDQLILPEHLIPYPEGSKLDGGR